MFSNPRNWYCSEEFWECIHCNVEYWIFNELSLSSIPFHPFCSIENNTFHFIGKNSLRRLWVEFSDKLLFGRTQHWAELLMGNELRLYPRSNSCFDLTSHLYFENRIPSANQVQRSPRIRTPPMNTTFPH